MNAFGAISSNESESSNSFKVITTSFIDFDCKNTAKISQIALVTLYLQLNCAIVPLIVTRPMIGTIPFLSLLPFT